MLLRLCVAICLYFVVSAGMAHAQTVSLRPRIEARGPQITIGDIFSGAPADVANRQIAPAPSPGQITNLSAPMLSTIASAAGLDWAPPAGVTEIRVVRPGGARATLPANSTASGVNSVASDIAIRRGEAVTVSYQVPGVRITQTGTRALDSGVVGQTIRLRAGERTIDAIVTGPGAARASP